MMLDFVEGKLLHLKIHDDVLGIDLCWESGGL